MKPFTTKAALLLSCCIFLFTVNETIAQTKKIKRPSSTVGISSVDTFVRESFNIYDKVYMYDGYAVSGKSLDDSDIDVLEQAIDNVSGLLDSAPNILSDLDGKSVLKQSKATLQVNRAKKALKYSLKTAKELLSGKHKKDKEDNGNSSTDESEEQSSETENTNKNTKNEEAEDANFSDNLEVYSKFDFVPGDKLLFFDDYANDFIGDFPAKWNTNGSGEIVTVGSSQQRWLGILSGYKTYYVPDVPNLPEEYTIEFDILTSGLDKQTSSTAILKVVLSDDANFGAGDNYIRANIPFCQYSAIGIRIQNYINRGQKEGAINNVVTADIRKAVLNKPHISIAVNKQRYRLWVNQKKYIDVPRGVPNGLTSIKFEANNLKDGKERIFITNLKVAEGGVDLRRKLLSEGKISTNGILFDSGSANIQPQSMGIIRQISQVLQQDGNIKLKIVGHTDADGNDATNLELSKKRAASVKNALTSIFNVPPDRLQTDGKGETSPVGDNSTADGKAKNRRVEFIKI